MLTRKFKVRRLSRSIFSRYGWLIDFPRRSAPKNKNLFRIVVRQPKGGWRIAYLVVRDKAVRKIEQHPDSLESFEPVKGRGLLYVAAKGDPRALKCFLLDRPVVLKKGVWHAVVALSREFDVKITENARVKCVYRPLGFEL